MAVPFSNTKLRAPRGFRNILEGFSREILRSQPSDIYAFGSLYFEKLLQIRAESGIDPVEFGAQEEDRFYNNKVYARDAVLHENDQEREMAALKIQTKYRQYTAKKVVREKREEKAAVKIQACFRGHLDRKYVHSIKCAAEHVETEAKEMARVEDEEEEEKEGDSPSKIMVADFPDKRGKLEDTVKEQASVQLEKKGDAVSEEQQQKDEKEMTEKKEGKVEEGKEEEQSDEIDDKEEAATRIQAGMRGMLTRMTLKGQLIPGEETEEVEKKVEAEDEKETKEKKEDEEEDTVSQNDETSDMDEAATRIQAGMRGMLTRMTLKGQLIPGEETGEDEKDGQKEEGEKEESGTKEGEKEESGTKEEEKEESGTKEKEKEESGTKEEEKEETGTKDANEENDTEEKE